MATSENKKSLLKKIIAIILGFGPGFFAIGYTIGTGSVTAMIVAGSEHGMALLWVLFLSCLFSGVLMFAYGNYALVTNDLKSIKEALNAYKTKIINGEDYLEEDLLFHLAIAKASKNNTMLTLMLLITPPILATYDKDTVCDGDKAISEIEKHENIYLAIEAKDLKLAKKMMENHFFKLSKYIE